MQVDVAHPEVCLIGSTSPAATAAAAPAPAAAVAVAVAAYQPDRIPRYLSGARISQETHRLQMRTIGTRTLLEPSSASLS